MTATDAYEKERRASLDYLGSAEALHAIETDAYWPKWHGPWWHMLLLHEMGLTDQIPETMVRSFVASLNRIPIKHFPIHPEDLPEGVDPYRGTPCHCQLGNVYQVLAAWGINVDKEVPWIRPWFYRYQMPDGGLNCDNAAYSVRDEIPSSMVGTIAAFEAVLLYTPKPWSAEAREFVTRGAQFLISRKLMLGSATKHNAEERESAKDWLQLCFPRFYLYDVLRGLNALLLWSEIAEQTIPGEAIAEVVAHMSERFSDGKVTIGRHCYAGTGTIIQAPSGEWLRRQPATFFPLLTSVSEIGCVSPFLSQQWASAQAKLGGVQRCS